MAELRNIKWNSLIGTLCKKVYLKALLKSRSLQWWLTLGLRDNGYVMLDDLEGLVLEYKGVRFLPDVYNYARMFEAWDRYPALGKLRPDDTVLDLGANIGSFTLPAAKATRKVIAVEPIFYKALQGNIKLNGLNNVEVLPVSVIESRVDAGLSGLKTSLGLLHTESLSAVLDEITIWRMDIGGAEWSLSIPHFRKVRLFEIEFHFYTLKQRKEGNWSSWKNFFQENGYGYTARWSKHRHWLYVSAEKVERPLWREYQLRDGSFRGESLKIWRENV